MRWPFFSILKRRKNCVYSRIRGLGRYPTFMKCYVECHISWCGHNFMHNFRQWIVVAIEVWPLFALFRKWQCCKWVLTWNEINTSWANFHGINQQTQSLTIDSSKSCNKMFSLRVEEDVREVEKFLALFFFVQIGYFSLQFLFSFHLVVLDFVGKVRKEIGLIGSRRMISREEAAKEWIIRGQQ